MRRMHRLIVNGLKGALILLTAAVIVSVSWGVFTRYVLQSAAEWTGEFSGYCLVWITFLGSAYALFQKSHIRFESLIDMLPRPIKLIIESLFNLGMLVFVSAVAFYGGKLAFMSMGDETLSLPFTKGVVYLALPIGGVLMAIGFLVELIELFAASRSDSKRQRFDEPKEAALGSDSI